MKDADDPFDPQATERLPSDGDDQPTVSLAALASTLDDQATSIFSPNEPAGDVEFDPNETMVIAPGPSPGASHDPDPRSKFLFQPATAGLDDELPSESPRSVPPTLSAWGDLSAAGDDVAAKGSTESLPEAQPFPRGLSPSAQTDVAPPSSLDGNPALATGTSAWVAPAPEKAPRHEHPALSPRAPEPLAAHSEVPKRSGARRLLVGLAFGLCAVGVAVISWGALGGQLGPLWEGASPSEVDHPPPTPTTAETGTHSPASLSAPREPDGGLPLAQEGIESPAKERGDEDSLQDDVPETMTPPRAGKSLPQGKKPPALGKSKNSTPSIARARTRRRERKALPQSVLTFKTVKDASRSGLSGLASVLKRGLVKGLKDSGTVRFSPTKASYAITAWVQAIEVKRTAGEHQIIATCSSALSAWPSGGIRLNVRARAGVSTTEAFRDDVKQQVAAQAVEACASNMVSDLAAFSQKQAAASRR